MFDNEAASLLGANPTPEHLLAIPLELVLSYSGCLANAWNTRFSLYTLGKYVVNQ